MSISIAQDFTLELDGTTLTLMDERLGRAHEYHDVDAVVTLEKNVLYIFHEINLASNECGILVTRIKKNREIEQRAGLLAVQRHGDLIAGTVWNVSKKAGHVLLVRRHSVAGPEAIIMALDEYPMIDLVWANQTTRLAVSYEDALWLWRPPSNHARLSLSFHIPGYSYVGSRKLTCSPDDSLIAVTTILLSGTFGGESYRTSPDYMEKRAKETVVELLFIDMRKETIASRFQFPSISQIEWIEGESLARVQIRDPFRGDPYYHVVINPITGEFTRNSDSW